MKGPRIKRILLRAGHLLIMGLLLAFSLSPATAQGPSGEDLVRRLSCHGCHALAGRGGDRGPSWDQVGKRLSPEAMKKQLASPKGHMPNFAHLRPEELNAVVEYLLKLK